MDVADPAADNKGLTKRVTFTKKSNVVELLTPIHSDILVHEKCM